MGEEHRATAENATSSLQTPSKLWRDTPEARAWFKRFGAVWGGPNGLIAQASRQAKGI